jgi:hypothetical protein
MQDLGLCVAAMTQEDAEVLRAGRATASYWQHTK